MSENRFGILVSRKTELLNHLRLLRRLVPETQAAMGTATTPEDRELFMLSLAGLPRCIAETEHELNEVAAQLKELGYEVNETW